MSRVEAEIDLGAIRWNTLALRVATGRGLIAVVKANGYGLGVVSVGEAAFEGGARMLAARLRYLAELAPRFAQAFDAITQSGLAAELRYESSLAIQASDALPLRAQLASAIAAARRRDLARRQTTVGPHVDDVVFVLGGHEARAFASQGQLRALVLAWKTAEIGLLHELHGDAPILLLDDVSSELDAKRNTFLFDFLAHIECQCFVTTTHPKHVLVQENRQDFQIVEGVLEGA